MAWWDALTGLIPSAATVQNLPRAVLENVVGGGLGAMRGAGGGPVDTSDYWGALAEQKERRKAHEQLQALSQMTGVPVPALEALGPAAFGKPVMTSKGLVDVGPMGVRPVTGAKGEPLMPPVRAGANPVVYDPRRGVLVNKATNEVTTPPNLPPMPPKTYKPDKPESKASTLNSIRSQRARLLAALGKEPRNDQMLQDEIRALDQDEADLTGKPVRPRKFPTVEAPLVPPPPPTWKDYLPGWLGGGSNQPPSMPSPSPTPGPTPVPTPPAPKQLTADLARQYLQRAGGDKNKARALARQDGYTF